MSENENPKDFPENKKNIFFKQDLQNIYKCGNIKFSEIPESDLK